MNLKQAINKGVEGELWAIQNEEGSYLRSPTGSVYTPDVMKAYVWLSQEMAVKNLDLFENTVRVRGGDAG